MHFHLSSVLVLGLALFVQSCTYAISPEVRAKADRSITFAQIYTDPGLYANKTVILGGVIAGTKRLKKGSLIEVIQKELDYWGKPRRTERSGGRFFVLHPAYLDPMIYAPGRDITVAGEVTGEEQKVPDGTIYPYPVIKSREMKLWPQQPQSSWERPDFSDPFYDPYYQPGRSGN